MAIVSSTDGSPTHDRLEAPLQRGVLFDVLAILVERRGADAAQFAAGQGRLEQIGRVAAAFGPAGADDRVQFVDEEDDVAGVGHFAQHGLEPLLELAAELRAGHQRAHVERDHPPVLEAFGHVGVDDPQGEPFGDGRLAHARLADQHGVVLRAPREDLHDAADFLVAADHRIELSLPGPLDQIDAVALAAPGTCPRAFWSVTRALPRTACKHLEQFLVGDGVELQDVLGLRVDLRQRQQQMLGRDELVLHRVGFALGRFEHLVQLAADLRRRAAGDAGEMAQFGLDDLVQLAAVDADAVEDRADDAVALGQQRGQQVQRVDLRMPAIGRQFLRRATASWALSVSLSNRNAMIANNGIPQMTTDEHGCTRRLRQRYALTPSVFIRVHLWFLASLRLYSFTSNSASIGVVVAAGRAWAAGPGCGPAPGAAPAAWAPAFS